jgi:hypothetical protein
MLALLIVAHAIADYPLQGNALTIQIATMPAMSIPAIK